MTDEVIKQLLFSIEEPLGRSSGSLSAFSQQFGKTTSDDTKVEIIKETMMRRANPEHYQAAQTVHRGRSPPSQRGGLC